MKMDKDRELRDAEQRWLNGGSALPVVALLASRGAKVEAAAVARLALSQAECPDAKELKAVVAGLSVPPAAWEDALAEFAKSPSLERWRKLMRFVPPERAYLRQQDAMRRLRGLGVDGNLLFLCACEHGLIPDAIDLVEQGCAAVETIVGRAARAGQARATYLGLAAEAAFLAGDMLGTLRLLRESMAHENEWCSALPHATFIRERASSEQRTLLDRAGIPRA